MSEMNITIGETSKRHGKLRILLLAFALVAALVAAPVVTAESASAASSSGYALCPGYKQSGAQFRVNGTGTIHLHNSYFGKRAATLSNKYENRITETGMSRVWAVSFPTINYAWSACK